MCNGGHSEEILYVHAMYLYTPLRLCIIVAHLEKLLSSNAQTFSAVTEKSSDVETALNAKVT